MSNAKNDREFKKLQRKLGTLGTTFSREAPRDVRIIGEEIMTDVKNSAPGRGVPVDGGTLRSTGRVEGSNPVRLTFGGPAARYALVQHERLDYRHRLGEARYLVRGLERYQFDRSSALQALRRTAALAMQIARSV